MICSNCKISNDVGALFCRECGSPQLAAQEPLMQGSASVGAPPASTIAATISAGSDTLIGSTIDGRYRIESMIGTGGMGTVYRGTRLLIGDEVAIKILHPEQTAVAGAAERFRREAQAAARLKHPNAVSVYDFGVSRDGLFYIVLEHVEGESVRDIIR
ncbi:MAG: protein kinase, partial [Acidobacteria bacterium]|nr:protein kinase [Acidobacteriota bacterium]